MIVVVVVSLCKCVRIIRNTVNLNRLSWICANINSLDGLRNVFNGLIILYYTYRHALLSFVTIFFLIYLELDSKLEPFCLSQNLLCISYRMMIHHPSHHGLQYLLSVSNMHEINTRLVVKHSVWDNKYIEMCPI